MNTIRFVKSFSKGQITIPKEFRDAFGITGEFWLKLSLAGNKIIAEPVEHSKEKLSYKQKLLQIKQIPIDPKEIASNRKQVEKQLLKRAL